MDHIVHRVLRFDRFALDLARGCLRAGDQDIDLRPKTFEVLRYLTENAGRLVPKQQLFEAVWPNVSVSDDSLVQCIRELRQKLGDEDHRLIKTVSRRGYLLDATVWAQAPQSLSGGSAPAEGPPKPAARLDVLHWALSAILAHQSRMWGAAAAGLMCAALGIVYLIGPPLLIANPGHVSLAENGAAESHQRRTFKDCEHCPEMVALPAGEFLMGSPFDELGHREAEGLFPRRVIIPKPIGVGKFEVTVDQFLAFVGETGTSAGSLCRVIVGDNPLSPTIPNPLNSFVLGPPEASFRQPGFAITGSHPAVCINWHDAQEYVGWLRRKIGKPYRLPTEAEWEYAARAGTQTRYSFGNDPTELCAHARFANASTPFPFRSGCGGNTAGPLPVGQLKANPWGIFDMHGNAWEWVEDCWTADVSQIPTDGSAFSPSSNCWEHVIRGGSWANGPLMLRSAARRGNNAEFRQNHFGFRVALSLGD